jgi:hypothetical protein
VALKDLPEEMRKQLESPEALRMLLGKHGGVRATARALDIHHSTVADFMAKAGIEASEIRKGAAVFEDKKETFAPQDIDAYIETAIALQEQRERLFVRQTEATITLDDEKPVGLVETADWHVGAAGTDLRLLRDDVAAMESTDGLYTIANGDYKDNQSTGPHKNKGGAHDQVEGPSTSELIVFRFMERLQERMLAVTTGCHDYWDVQQAGVDFAGKCAEKSQAVNLWHGGLLKLHLGGELYTSRIAHKWPGESNLNTMNTFRRQFDMEGFADIFYRAHLHFPEFHDMMRCGKRALGVRCGSYKIIDEHGQRLAHYKGAPGNPLLILYPDRHYMEVHMDFREGIKRLKQLRGA